MKENDASIDDICGQASKYYNTCRLNHDLDAFQHRSIMTIRTGGTTCDVLGARLTHYIGTSQN